MTVSTVLAPEVADALQGGIPVVALESTLIAHGLPWPVNLDTARDAEAAVRKEGAIPATIAVIDGKIRIGLNEQEIGLLARSEGVLKAGRRDLAAAVARRRTAATTVSGTMLLAHRAGIRLVATGGIGGVHRGGHESLDISADLFELARSPVCVVCAGAKSILDVRLTLEYLETHSAPVVGYQTEVFPAFYSRSSGHPVSATVTTPAEAAALLNAHWELGGAGVVLAQPPPSEVALDPQELEAALRQAEAEAKGVHGPSVTPFLLRRLAELTQGRTLAANRALVVANAALAARVATSLCGRGAK